MALCAMKDLLVHAREHNYAVPSFCAWNTEIVAAVLRISKRLNSPVIIMGARLDFAPSGAAEVLATTRALLELFDVPCAMHLDHGDSVAYARECLDVGFTSLMLDFSARQFEENVAALKEVVDMARPQGVTVEGELGAVGRVGDETIEGEHGSTLTDPAAALEFVERTRIDCLAVSIGNVHGHYTSLPSFDFDRLEQIHKAVDIPLVLHGGSGTPDEDIRHAISLGIAKVNVATALVKPLRESLMKQWNAGENVWVPVAVGEAMPVVERAIEEWILRVGSDGKVK
jgi:tagatose 1,6-diphosphate aldolase GatY/KbaY